MSGLPPIDIDPHVHYPEGRARAWIAWSIPGLFFLYEFMIRVLPGVIEKPLQQELGVSAGDIGLSMSFYYYAYGPMQIVVGLLLDKLGARGPLTVAALVCSVGALTFAAGTSLTGLGAGRFLMGFGSAFAYVGTVYIATIWFPGRRVAMISGLTVTLGMLGAITAESMLEFLLEKTSWQHVMYGFAGAGVVLAVLLAIMVPNRPQWFKERIRQSTSHGGRVSTLACLKQVLTNRQTLLLGLITGLVYLPVGTFAAFWGFRYLNTVLHIDHKEDGPFVSIIFLGLAAGGPLVGWLSDTTGRRKFFLVIGTAVGVISTGSLLLLPPGMNWLLMINLGVIGLVVSILVVAFPMAMEQNPCYARGTALTFVNLTQMVFAGTGQWVVGMLLDARTSGNVGEQEFTAGEFKTAFVLLPASMLVAFFLSLFLREPNSRGTGGAPAGAAAGPESTESCLRG